MKKLLKTFFKAMLLLGFANLTLLIIISIFPAHKEILEIVWSVIYTSIFLLVFIESKKEPKNQRTRLNLLVEIFCLFSWTRDMLYPYRFFKIVNISIRAGIVIILILLLVLVINEAKVVENERKNKKNPQKAV